MDDNDPFYSQNVVLTKLNYLKNENVYHRSKMLRALWSTLKQTSNEGSLPSKLWKKQAKPYQTKAKAHFAWKMDETCREHRDS